MKNLIVVIFSIVLFSSLASAQAKPGGIARQIALGGSANQNIVLNPFIVTDPLLMLVNPAYQVGYNQYGWVNIGGVDGYGYQSAGLSLAANDNWNVGIILSYDPSAISQLSLVDIAMRQLQTLPRVENATELVVSTHHGSADFGVGLLYGWAGRDNNSHSYTNGTSTSSTDDEVSSRVFGVRAGVKMYLESGAIFDFSGAIRFDKRHDKLSSTPADTSTWIYARHGGEYSGSGTELQFDARGVMKVSERFSFVPYGGYYGWSSEPTQDAPPPLRSSESIGSASSKVSYTRLAFGVGGEYRTHDLLLVGGISYKYMKYESELHSSSSNSTSSMSNDQSESDFPAINAGIEWMFLDWLTGRMGYYRTVTMTNNTSKSTTNYGSGNVYDNSSESNITAASSFVNIPGYWSDGLVTLGVGFKFSGFALDATVSEQALRRGLGLIGSSDAMNTFGYMTASYNLGE